MRGGFRRLLLCRPGNGGLFGGCGGLVRVGRGRGRLCGSGCGRGRCHGGCRGACLRLLLLLFPLLGDARGYLLGTLLGGLGLAQARGAAGTHVVRGEGQLGEGSLLLDAGLWRGGHGLVRRLFGALYVRLVIVGRGRGVARGHGLNHGRVLDGRHGGLLGCGHGLRLGNRHDLGHRGGCGRGRRRGCGLDLGHERGRGCGFNLGRSLHGRRGLGSRPDGRIRAGLRPCVLGLQRRGGRSLALAGVAARTATARGARQARRGLRGALDLGGGIFPGFLQDGLPGIGLDCLRRDRIGLVERLDGWHCALGDFLVRVRLVRFVLGDVLVEGVFLSRGDGGEDGPARGHGLLVGAFQLHAGAQVVGNLRHLVGQLGQAKREPAVHDAVLLVLVQKHGAGGVLLRERRAEDVAEQVRRLHAGRVLGVQEAHVKAGDKRLRAVHEHVAHALAHHVLEALAQAAAHVHGHAVGQAALQVAALQVVGEALGHHGVVEELLVQLALAHHGGERVQADEEDAQVVLLDEGLGQGELLRGAHLRGLDLGLRGAVLEGGLLKLGQVAHEHERHGEQLAAVAQRAGFVQVETLLHLRGRHGAEKGREHGGSLAPYVVGRTPRVRGRRCDRTAMVPGAPPGCGRLVPGPAACGVMCAGHCIRRMCTPRVEGGGEGERRGTGETPGDASGCIRARARSRLQVATGACMLQGGFSQPTLLIRPGRLRRHPSPVGCTLPRRDRRGSRRR